jgi:hypothetical protein
MLSAAIDSMLLVKKQQQTKTVAQNNAVKLFLWEMFKKSLITIQTTSINIEQ